MLIHSTVEKRAKRMPDITVETTFIKITFQSHNANMATFVVLQHPATILVDYFNNTYNLTFLEVKFFFGNFIYASNSNFTIKYIFRIFLSQNLILGISPSGQAQLKQFSSWFLHYFNLRRGSSFKGQDLKPRMLYRIIKLFMCMKYQ